MIFQNCYTSFHEPVGEWNLIQLWNITSGIYAKYHVQIMLLFVYTTTRKRFVMFTCRYFKLSWNNTALSQSNCRNFSCSGINRKIAQLTQNIWNFIVIACVASVSSRGSSPSTFFAYALTFKRLLRRLSLSDSRVYNKWQPSAIIREISDSNLETGRYGPKSGASRIIRESWLHSVIAKWTIILYFIFSLFNSLLTIIDLVVFYVLYFNR